MFMLAASLLIPFVMIGFGSRFVKNAPRKINIVYGYRTFASMKNTDTWTFAHGYCGKLWRVIGWIMLPISIGTMLLITGKEIAVVGIFGAALVIIQSLFLAISIILVEITVHKNFDRNGKRRV